jgi:hypothetical protein
MTLKPLAHWALQRKYKMRYTQRAENEVRGIFTTPAGEAFAFTFYPSERTLVVGDAPAVTLNEHGWEVNERGEVVFRSVKK